MNITCEQLDNLLLEGDPYSLQIAARHAEGCPACMEALTEWNEISTVAGSLHTTWQNDMLWPRIERALRREQRTWRGHLWQVAAALILAVALGAVSWRALQVRSEHRAFDKAIMNDDALTAVENAERTHKAAVAKLEKLAQPKLEEPPTPLMVSYKEKLMLLDDAIAECQANIKQNRQNAHLRRQLLAMYSEKQKTLQDVLREDVSHVSNQ